jgi:hypothetical protein
MPQSILTAENRETVDRVAALNLLACRRLAVEIENHAAALKSWAGILSLRLHSTRPVHEGTATMVRDIAAAMETEGSIAAGLARKLRQEVR